MKKYRKIIIYITLVTIFSLTACTASLLKNWGKRDILFMMIGANKSVFGIL
jgi:hypothetical protein